MTEHSRDDLWRDFPKTATEFERRFATEEDCRAYWIKARWGGKPACARCGSTYVWPVRDGTTFECRDCDHQTSLTAGTLLEKTRKPLKMWFRAVFEISTRRTGISAMDLMRIMGFGSYKTAWSWLHKLRASLVRPEREPLGPFVQMDEALVGGKGGPHKELVLVAAEVDGRVRLAHAETNDKATLKRFADGQVAADARVTTDGLASYDADSLGERPYERVVQSKAERREHDTLQVCHTTISLLKRWLLGTHAGAVGPKHLQAYLDEFAFRQNRRKTKGVGRIAARVIEQLVAHPPLTMRSLIDDTRRCRWFRQPEQTA
ncbi:MAG TPA: IS1595 family transposase [Hyphomicrobiaceae bacterium]|nr:IS1595 family transposase [Hyphomicrobiaceae bacterium]